MMTEPIDTTPEIWKQAVGYEGLYSVSNLGRVKSDRSDKIRKLTVDKNGYQRVSFRRRGKYHLPLVHRIVGLAFIPPIEGKPHINHKNGKKSFNHVSNLEWCNRKENAQHSIHVLGNCADGEKNARAILSDNNAIEIRRLFDSGIRPKAIAAKFGVSHNVIGHIVANRHWKHLPKAERQMPVHPFRGEHNGRAKLDPGKVSQIKNLLKSGLNYADIGKIFSVTKQLIYQIDIGKIWKHLL